jgi:hypothetical protein
MRSILAAAAAALLVCLTPALPAAAQTATTTPEPATIEVPFNPPLDTVLRYRVDNARAARPGQPALATNWIEELRFTRTADGLLAYWRMDWASLPALMRTPMMTPMIRPMTGEPIGLELDATGTPLRVHDWPATKARLIRAVEGTKAMIPPAQAAAVMPKLLAMFDGLTAESAVPMLLKNLSPVFDFGGVAMEIGETRTGPVEQPVPLINASVSTTMTLTLSAATPGATATFVSRTELDPESMRQLMAQLVARFGALDAAAAARQKQELAKSVDLSAETKAIVDLKTGLPTRFESRRTSSELPGKPFQTLVLTLIR